MPDSEVIAAIITAIGTLAAVIVAAKLQKPAQPLATAKRLKRRRRPKRR